MERMSRARLGRLAPRPWAALVVVLAVFVLAGCTEPPDEAPPPDPESVALRISTVTGGGELGEEDLSVIESEIGEVLSGYVGAAYLGEHPRTGYVEALDGFTDRAAELAARELDVLTAAGEEDLTAVRATRLDTDLSLYVVDGQALGATADVGFAFEATTKEGDSRELTLDGRLLLTRTQAGGAVFGYDVRSDDGEALGEDGS